MSKLLFIGGKLDGQWIEVPVVEPGAIVVVLNAMGEQQGATYTQVNVGPDVAPLYVMAHVNYTRKQIIARMIANYNTPPAAPDMQSKCVIPEPVKPPEPQEPHVIKRIEHACQSLKDYAVGALKTNITNIISEYRKEHGEAGQPWALIQIENALTRYGTAHLTSSVIGVISDIIAEYRANVALPPVKEPHVLTQIEHACEDLRGATPIALKQSITDIISEYRKEHGLVVDLPVLIQIESAFANLGPMHSTFSLTHFVLDRIAEHRKRQRKPVDIKFILTNLDEAVRRLSPSDITTHAKAHLQRIIGNYITSTAERHE